MCAQRSPGPTEERVEVWGRRFVLRYDRAVPPGRYAIRIWEGRRWPWRRPYLRAPIRGRDPAEARERALEILYACVGMDRFRAMAEAVARRVAPGSHLTIGENAREVTITLTGRYELEVPLAVSRHEVLDPEADPAQLRGLVRAHFEAYTRRR